MFLLLDQLVDTPESLSATPTNTEARENEYGYKYFPLFAYFNKSQPLPPLFKHERSESRSLLFFFSCYNVVAFKHRLNRPSYDLLPTKMRLSCHLVGNCIFHGETHSGCMHVSWRGWAPTERRASCWVGCTLPSPRSSTDFLMIGDFLIIPQHPRLRGEEDRRREEPFIELSGSYNQSFSPPSILIRSPEDPAGKCH